jgi:hypothetical protein
MEGRASGPAFRTELFTWKAARDARPSVNLPGL